MKEVTRVVSSLIEEIKRINHSIGNLEFLVDSYFEWKDEKGDLQHYVKQRVEKLNKNRDRDSVSNK